MARVRAWFHKTNQDDCRVRETQENKELKTGNKEVAENGLVVNRYSDVIKSPRHSRSYPSRDNDVLMSYTLNRSFSHPSHQTRQMDVQTSHYLLSSKGMNCTIISSPAVSSFRGWSDDIYFVSEGFLPA